MRASDLAEQSRIEATLDRIGLQLAHAGVPIRTGAHILEHARRTLLLRPPSTALGWLITWHNHDGQPHDTRHVGLPDLTLAIAQGAGRLGILIDLEQLWRKGAGDLHALAESAQRMPKEPDDR